jgi:hypothetical protein
MSAYAWAVRPNGWISHRGHRGRGGVDAVLGALRVLGELVAFAYRLRTGSGLRGAGSAVR